jgi:CRISPR-associated protein Cas5h
MKAISFELSGKTAFFKKPDVNAYAYFTYNNIHKPALLGVLGAIIGLGGYTQLFDKNRGLKKNNPKYDNGFPEFYEKLKHLKVSITPLSENGYFTKKIQTFNNSVGYASKEMGGNLIVREQWLESPKWRILIQDDESEEFKKISDYLINKKSVFIPYLGKNDHFATISKVKIIELSKPTHNYIDSLFIKNFEELNGFFAKEDEIPFLFKEVTPIRLQKEYHFYEYETLVFTNYEIEKLPKETYCYDDKNYTFI